MNLIEKLVQFVLENRNEKVFENWTNEDLKVCLWEGITNGSTLFSTNECGVVDGIIVTDIYKDSKRVHVLNIITKHPNCLKNFFIMFLNRFPSFELTAHRKGKLVTYDLKRFKKHLLKIK